MELGDLVLECDEKFTPEELKEYQEYLIEHEYSYTDGMTFLDAFNRGYTEINNCDRVPMRCVYSNIGSNLKDLHNDEVIKR